MTKVLPSAATVTALQVHGSGKLLGVGQADGWVSVWDHELNAATWKRKFGVAPITGIALGDGFVALSQGAKVEFVNTTTGKTFKTFKTLQEAQGMVFVPGIEDVLFAFGSTHVMIFDTKRREEIDAINLGGDVARAGVADETDGDGPQLWVEFDQGQWLVRRTYRVARPSREGPIQMSLTDTQWRAQP